MLNFTGALEMVDFHFNQCVSKILCSTLFIVFKS